MGPLNTAFQRCVLHMHKQTCVRPGVPLQLVTARETLPTEHPVADERPLACVQPHMSPEQRRLPEGLLTAGDVADVLPLPDLPGPVGQVHKHAHTQTQFNITE